MSFPRQIQTSGGAATMGVGCASLFGGVFIMAGLAIGIFAYFPAVLGWWQAQSWVEVPCWIEQVEKKESSDSDGGTTYSVKAQYRYEFDGQKIRGERVGLVSGGDNIGDYQHRVYDELSHYQSSQRPFRCFVNPQKPEDALLYVDLRWGLLLLMSLFPTLFPLVGGVIAIGGVWAARKEGREVARSRLLPEEPWRWKDEWSGGAITPQADGLMTFSVIALWILLVQLPLTVAVMMSGAIAESWLACFVLLPLMLAWSALLAVWRRVKVRQTLGRVNLLLTRWPVSPGETLEGRLCFSQALSPRLTLQVKACCLASVTRGAGKGETTSQETLWEEVMMLSAVETQREGRGCALDLRFDLPVGIPGSTADLPAQSGDEKRGHVWQLEVSADPTMKPVLLPLPVFSKPREGGAERQMSQATKLPPVNDSQLEQRLHATGIKASFREDGAPERILCLPRRNRAIAIMLLVFGSIWMSIFFVLVNRDAPLFFKIIWGVTAPLIELWGLRLLLHTRQLEAAEDSLRLVQMTGPFFIRTRTLDAADIRSFSQKVTSQATYLNRSVTYYTVQAEIADGSKVTLVDSLTEETTAEEVVRRLELWKKSAIR